MSARQFISGLATRLRPLVPGVCRCAARDKAEQKARAQLGMPVLHPERIVRGMKRGQEEWLSAVASELWPDDEYTAIAADPWREDEL